MPTRKPADFYWYARNVSKFKKDTAHLSLAEMGAYDRLLDQYYLQRSHLSKDRVQLYRICAAITPDEQKAVDSVIAQYFTEAFDGLHHDYADAEIQKSKELSDKRRKAQALGDEAKGAKAGTIVPSKGGTRRGSNGGAKGHTITITNTEDSPLTPQGENSDALDFKEPSTRSAPSVSGSVYRVLDQLSDDQGIQIRANHPGWSIQEMARMYDAKVNAGEWQQPKNAFAAFNAFIATHTKGKTP